MDQNELMNKKHKMVSIISNCSEHFLFFLISGITSYVSISAFVSLLGMSIGITSTATGLKICAITIGIKKCKSTINN